MRPILSTFILVCAFFYVLPEQAVATECTNPGELRDLHSCFAGPRPAYLVALRYSGLSAASTASAINNACRDFSEPLHGSGNFFGKIVDRAYAGLISPVYQDIPTVLKDMLGGSPIVQDYEKKLSQIAKIKDRYERIRKVYELAVASQGDYDEADSGMHSTPGATLELASKGKPGGVCRDFAKLLEWSLLKVNRSPALSEETKKWGGLDEDSFSVTTEVDIFGRHVWVDVLLPVGTGDKQVFHRISLDSTFYRNAYSPLFQRRSEISEETDSALLTECHAVADCVQKVALKYLPTAKNLMPAGASCTGL